MKAIVGRKMGMTEVFTEDGQIYAVTVVESYQTLSHKSKLLKKTVMPLCKLVMKN